MARFQSSAAAAALTTSLPTADSIQAGDLVALGSDGNAYWCSDPTLSAASTRPAFLAAALSFVRLSSSTAAVGTAANPAGNSCFTLQSVALSNGNVAHLWADSSDVLWVAIYDSGLNVVVAATSITTASSSILSNVSFGAVALVGGGFAVCYPYSSVGAGLAVYSNAGAVVKAPTQFDANTLSAGGFHLAALSGGGFAVCYDSYLGGNALAYAVFTAAGAVTKSPASTGQTIGNNNFFASSIAALSAGGFAIVLMNGANNVGFIIYSASGVQTVAFATVNTLAVGQYVFSAPMAGGGFAVAYLTTSGYGGLCVAVYNASGAQQGSTLTLDSVAYIPSGVGVTVALTALSAGVGVAWTRNDGTFAGYAMVNASGALVGSATLATGTSSIGQFIALMGAPDGGAVALYGVSGAPYMQKLGATGALVGSALLAPGTYASYGQVTLVSYGTTATFALTTAMPTAISATLWSDALMVARAPVGVALSAPSGGNVAVQISGSMTTRLSFSQSWNCNYNGLAAPGQRMSVVGNLAVMQGLQAASPIQIN